MLLETSVQTAFIILAVPGSEIGGYAPEFKKLHGYYTTREEKQLKKIKSLIVIACKILRIIFSILKNGIRYDLAKMLKDIKRIGKQEVPAAE